LAPVKNKENNMMGSGKYCSTINEEVPYFKWMVVMIWYGSDELAPQKMCGASFFLGGGHPRNPMKFDSFWSVCRKALPHDI